jgi:amino acid transporter
VAFLLALPDSAIGDKWSSEGKGLYTLFTGPFAEVATLLSIGWLAAIVYADAIISPARTGLIYTTGSSRVSYGLSRNGYVPTPFEWAWGSSCTSATSVRSMTRSSVTTQASA